MTTRTTITCDICGGAPIDGRYLLHYELDPPDGLVGVGVSLGAIGGNYPAHLDFHAHCLQRLMREASEMPGAPDA